MLWICSVAAAFAGRTENRWKHVIVATWQEINFNRIKKENDVSGIEENSNKNGKSQKRADRKSSSSATLRPPPNTLPLPQQTQQTLMHLRYIPFFPVLFIVHALPT